MDLRIQVTDPFAEFDLPVAPSSINSASCFSPVGLSIACFLMKVSKVEGIHAQM